MHKWLQQKAVDTKAENHKITTHGKERVLFPWKWTMEGFPEEGVFELNLDGKLKRAAQVEGEVISHWGRTCAYGGESINLLEGCLLTLPAYAHRHESPAGWLCPQVDGGTVLISLKTASTVTACGNGMSENHQPGGVLRLFSSYFLQYSGLEFLPCDENSQQLTWKNWC